MSGTDEPIREPQNDAEWSRQTTRRLESLESPTSQRIGDWVLSTSSDGHLIASNISGGSVVLARKPASGENNPDEIVDFVPPAVTAIRQASQSIASSGTTVIWDGVSVEVGGDWSSGKQAFESVMVPVAGVYAINASVHFDNGAAFLTAGVIVDGQARLSGRFDDSSGGAWMTATCVGQLALDAGSAVSLLCAADTGTRNIGSAALFSTPVPSHLALSFISGLE